MSDDAALAERLAAEVRGAAGVAALYPAGRRRMPHVLPGSVGRHPEIRVRQHAADTDVTLSIGVDLACSAPRTAATVRDVVRAALVAEGRVPGTVTVRVSTVG